QPVDVLARARRQQVDVLDQAHVLLIGEAPAGQILGVDRGVLFGLFHAHRQSPVASRCESRTASSSCFFSSSRRISASVSCSVTPGMYVVPASGTRAIAAASVVSAHRSSGSRLWMFVLPQARASICTSSVSVCRML